jgi:precorrin-6B methylase 2
MSILVALGLSVLFFILVLLWIFVPFFHGRPSIPTKPERIRKALQLAQLQPNEVLYDLGAGDGGVLLIASREFGARPVGIEAGLLQFAWLWLRIAASGLADQIQIRWANTYKTELHDADVVFVHATSREVGKLTSHLEKQLKKGARLISISADFPDWEPSAFDDRALIFLYEMPPTRGSMTSYMLKRAK